MIAIIKNVRSEGPGTIERYLIENKISYRIFEAEDGETPSTLENYKGLVVLGGPMGVYEMEKYPGLKVISRLIREAINRNLKVLGICLGAQLIAHTLGAEVYKGHGEEIGWHEVELTGEALRDPLMLSLAKHPSVGDIWKKFKVFHWHGDTFDLPLGAIHLARSALYENQAFKYKNNVYALQFHIEVTKELLNEWFEDHPLGKNILKESEKIMAEYSQRAENFYKAFFANLV
ncbi:MULTISPECIES: type 1 glutamine amidotransferase [Thermodesulfovibrio]|jgi:GMP synthase-like glutamine amidotransferase|uniref:type 1 glutamine amidotransferase n=1 Tax=Thermodesulfovibrio TaxID=28261 RepID=UPI0026075DCE|nr:type 1 glutamine amidotransferase [Thermodesulfovibrio sp.]